jgi:MFS family permease
VPLAGILADRLRRSLTGGRILVQTFGLLAGAGFVFVVGLTRSVTTLLAAMTCFGFCKGFYDSNIFASIFDVVEPRARATAAGIMNTVGWGGGALGPLAVGWIAAHGRRPTEIENMSEAIAACSVVYLIGATFLLAAMFTLNRPRR